jgi:hypothetical protein
MLGVMLLYVGAVLIVNGIWLIGQARAAERQPAPAAAGAAGAGAAAVTVESDPAFIENREIAVLNLFTGFVGLVVAVTLMVQGNDKGDIDTIRGGAYILLFAFTYIWVAFNQFLNAGGHGFGWYCLFVAVTAVVAGIYTFSNADGNDASIYLGVDWFAWAFLWFLFFLVLTLERPIARFTGWMAILEGIGTSWVFAILLLENELAF